MREAAVNFFNVNSNAPVAQLDRASAYEAEGREFEPLRARHFFSLAMLQWKLSKSNLMEGEGLACAQPKTINLHRTPEDALSCST